MNQITMEEFSCAMVRQQCIQIWRIFQNLLLLVPVILYWPMRYLFVFLASTPTVFSYTNTPDFLISFPSRNEYKFYFKKYVNVNNIDEKSAGTNALPPVLTTIWLDIRYCNFDCSLYPKIDQNDLNFIWSVFTDLTQIKL